MLTPGSDHLCPGCSFLSDHTDAARQHFEHADFAFVAISRAPLDHIERVKKRMGWSFPWVSSAGTTLQLRLRRLVHGRSDFCRARRSYNYGTT